MNYKWNSEKAKITDVEAIHALINYYAEKGLMLARPRTLLYESLREFTIACDGDKVIAAGSLHIIWEDLAEIRALAVAPELYRAGSGPAAGQDVSRRSAGTGHTPQVFVLTYQQSFSKSAALKL